MVMVIKRALGLLAATGLLMAAGCPPKVTYDDPGALTVSKDWSDSDIRGTAGELAADLAKHPVIAEAKGTPVILPLDIKNKTSKRLNTSIIVSQIETDLMATGKVVFVDPQARESLAREYEYMASGNVDPATQKGPGKQTGCDYVLWGTIENVEARGHNEKVDYYYIKLTLVDVSKGTKVWQGQKEIKKRIRK
jgi:uncharacterized protein (TIGR02722 family)